MKKNSLLFQQVLNQKTDNKASIASRFSSLYGKKLTFLSYCLKSAILHSKSTLLKSISRYRNVYFHTVTEIGTPLEFSKQPKIHQSGEMDWLLYSFGNLHRPFLFFFILLTVVGTQFQNLEFPQMKKRVIFHTNVVLRTLIDFL